ncbi:ORF22 [Ictalurid herpesvirus 1]|nr:ORF22 [Ictalurid herpesvirus 1]
MGPIRKPANQWELSENVKRNLGTFGEMYVQYSTNPSQTAAAAVFKLFGQYLRTLFQTHLEIIQSDGAGDPSVRMDVLQRIEELLGTAVSDDSVFEVIEAHLSKVKDIFGNCSITWITDVKAADRAVTAAVTRTVHDVTSGTGAMWGVLDRAMIDLKTNLVLPPTTGPVTNFVGVALPATPLVPYTAGSLQGSPLDPTLDRFGALFGLFGLTVPTATKKVFLEQNDILNKAVQAVSVGYTAMNSNFQAGLAKYKPPRVPTVDGVLTARGITPDKPRQAKYETVKTYATNMGFDVLIGGKVPGSKGDIESLVSGILLIGKSIDELGALVEGIGSDGAIVSRDQMDQVRSLIDSLVKTIYDTDRDRFIAMTGVHVITEYANDLLRVLDLVTQKYGEFQRTISGLEPSWATIVSNTEGLIPLYAERAAYAAERAAIIDEFQKMAMDHVNNMKEVEHIRERAATTQKQTEERRAVDIQKLAVETTAKMTDMKNGYEKTIADLRAQLSVANLSLESLKGTLKGETTLGTTVAELSKANHQLESRVAELQGKLGIQENEAKLRDEQHKAQAEQIATLNRDLRVATERLHKKDTKILETGINTGVSTARVRELEQRVKELMAEKKSIRHENRMARRKMDPTEAAAKGGPRQSERPRSHTAVHAHCALIRKNLHDTNKRLLTRNTRLEKSISGKEELISSLTIKGNALSSQLADAREQHAVLKREYDALRAERGGTARTKKDALEALQSKLTQSESQLAIEKLKVMELEAAAKRLGKSAVTKSEVETVEVRVNLLTEELARTKKTVDELRKLNNAYLTAKDRLQARVDALTTDNQSMKLLVGNGGTLDEANKRITTLTQRLATVSGELVTATETLAFVRGSLKRVNHQRDELAKESAATKKSCEAQIRALTDRHATEMRTAAGARDGLEAELGRVKRTLVDTETKMAGIERDRVVLRDELTRMQKASHIGADRQLTHAEKVAHDMGVLNAGLTLARTELREIQRELVLEKNKSRDAEQRHVASETALREQIRTLTDERDRLLATGVADLQRENAELHAAITEAANTCADTKIQLENITADYNSLLAEYERRAGRRSPGPVDTPATVEEPIAGYGGGNWDTGSGTARAPIDHHDMFGISSLLGESQGGLSDYHGSYAGGRELSSEESGDDESVDPVPDSNGTRGDGARQEEDEEDGQEGETESGGEEESEEESEESEDEDPPSAGGPLELIGVQPGGIGAEPESARVPSRRPVTLLERRGAHVAEPKPTPRVRGKRSAARHSHKRVHLSITRETLRLALAAGPEMSAEEIFQRLNTDMETSSLINSLTVTAVDIPRGQLAVLNRDTAVEYATPGTPVSDRDHERVELSMKAVLLIMICAKHGIVNHEEFTNGDLSWFKSYDNNLSVTGSDSE